MENEKHSRLIETYTTLVLKMNEPLQPVIEKFIEYYHSMIKPFFEDCADPVKLNKMLDGKELPYYGLV